MYDQVVLVELSAYLTYYVGVKELELQPLKWEHKNIRQNIMYRWLSNTF